MSQPIVDGEAFGEDLGKSCFLIVYFKYFFNLSQTQIFLFLYIWNLMIFQTLIIWRYTFQNLKYPMPMTLGCNDIGISKTVFVTKTQFLK